MAAKVLLNPKPGKHAIASAGFRGYRATMKGAEIQPTGKAVDAPLRRRTNPPRRIPVDFETPTRRLIPVLQIGRG